MTFDSFPSKKKFCNSKGRPRAANKLKGIISLDKFVLIV